MTFLEGEVETVLEAGVPPAVGVEPLRLYSATGGSHSGAGCGAGMPDPEPQFSRHTLNPGDLATGRIQGILRIDQNVSPKIACSILRTRAPPIFDQEPFHLQNAH